MDATKEEIRKERVRETFSEIDDDEYDSIDEDEESSLADMVPHDVFIKWREHLYTYSVTRKLKRDSKQLAAEEDGLVYCCFDLQQILDCPFTNVGDAFYKRCLSCYNFVVNDSSNAYCYF